MEWKEFVTAWAKQEHPIASLELSAPLTDEELECVLAMFPDVGTDVEIKDACKKCLIGDRKFKDCLRETYIKCDLPTNDGKRPLRDRLISEYNRLIQYSTPTPSTNLDSIVLSAVNSSSSQIDWLAISHQLLTEQKNLTTNPLQLGANRNLDDVHVPLGLMERRERPQVKQEPSPEMGSQLLQPTELTETRGFEHDEFLAEVVGKRTTNGKHIAIIGEPGAGKTTLLTKIGEWLLNSASQSEPAIVVWVSLASLESQDLSDYLYGDWLKHAHPAARPPDSWATELKNLIINKRVWLLLDGLDETSRSDPPSWLNHQLSGWGKNLRVVVTCRLNQWDGASNSLVNNFEVYRTLDYEYRTATGEDRVLEFLTKWFENPDTAKQIRTSLDDPGKERIKDLVKNPLRLTLLCASWDKDKQALPDTQAELYERFVNYLYDWKKQEFRDAEKQRPKLDRALGELAKVGLNRQPNSMGAVRRFRFIKREIAEIWGEQTDTLLTAASQLGWLVKIGTEVGADVYAFFHPTFQEYFAACSIKHWDYFLPKKHINSPVPCIGEKEPTYRVFEKEWQQTILLWIGRGDVRNDWKEGFIDKLTDFREQEGKFYFYRAYCLAAICVGEFKSSQKAQEIVARIVAFRFGYLDNEEERWVTFYDDISSLAYNTIPLTHREYAIDTLVELLDRDNLDEELRYNVVKALGRIGVGNERAIASLIQLLKRDNLDDYNRLKIAETLREMAVGNSIAIASITELLNRDNLGIYSRVEIAIILIKNDAGNSIAIQFLTECLNSNNLDIYYRLKAVQILIESDAGNSIAIASLTQLLNRDNLDIYYRLKIAETLIKIDGKKPIAIQFLIECLNSNNLDVYNRLKAAQILREMAVGNYSIAIASLTQLLKRDNLDIHSRLEIAKILIKIDGKKPIAIQFLIECLNSNNLDVYDRLEIAKILIKIDDKKLIAIQFLTEYLNLNSNNLDVYNRLEIAKILVENDVGNSIAIPSLAQLLNYKNSSCSLLLGMAQTFSKIYKGTPRAFHALIQLFNRDDVYNGIRLQVVESLSEIDEGIPIAIELLVQLLNRDDLSTFHQLEVIKKLSKIDKKNPLVNSLIIQLLNRDDLSTVNQIRTASILIEVDVVNSTMFSTLINYLKKSKSYSSVIFHCAQTLPYPTFHAAWHQTHLPTIPLSLPTLQNQLNRPHTILLNITSLSTHNPTEIPQTLTNLIYSQLAIQPIPLVATISQLQTHLLNLNLAPHLVVIPHHSNPPHTNSLVQAIDLLQIPKQIQILWLSNSGTIPDAISPDSSDLVAAIESAIDRFTES